MRLAEFILANTEPILADWEAFARSIWPGVATNPLALRDHAKDILRATALDMQSVQTATQQSDKSKGDGSDGVHSVRVNRASDVHAVARVNSGFDLLAVVAEYRALRASVVRLWRESGAQCDMRDIDSITRFHESIDQSLTEAIRSYTERVDGSRQMFLAILGHDLRNPLNSIMMSAQVLSLEDQVDAELRQMASGIAASAAAMAGMISDLLDFTGAGLGVAMPFSPGAMDLNDLCREVIDEMRAGYPTKVLHFAAQGEFTMEGDASRLRQVVSNLLGNAIHHGTGPVELSLRAEGSDVLLTVHNGGPPIPPDLLPTIFDPLVRGTSTESRQQRRPGSIGLGLYVAREVVTAHGGSIDVKSSATDGTLFTVRLPRRRSR